MLEGLSLALKLRVKTLQSQPKLEQFQIDCGLKTSWLFRAAGAELVEGDAPPKVVISEYVDVAKAFFPEGREPKFVNAVLDHMAREAKPEAF